jgi:DNA-binding Xre family transcriptional regulator
LWFSGCGSKVKANCGILKEDTSSAETTVPDSVRSVKAFVVSSGGQSATGVAMTFRQKLLDLMRSREWSVSKLAQESGLSFPTVRSYTASGKNNRLPNVRNLFKIAAALGVAIEEFRKCEEFVNGDKEGTSKKS